MTIRFVSVVALRMMSNFATGGSASRAGNIASSVDAAALAISAAARRGTSNGDWFNGPQRLEDPSAIDSGVLTRTLYADEHGRE